MAAFPFLDLVRYDHFIWAAAGLSACTPHALSGPVPESLKPL